MSSLQDYFNFTRKERNGIIIIIILMLLVLLLPLFFPLLIKQKQYDHSQFEKEIASLQTMKADSNAQEFDETKPARYKKSYGYGQAADKAMLFEFDPNTISADGWKKLGLRDKTIATIQNYLNKGGKFYKPEDIAKIWGLHADEVQRLLPYVKIAVQENKYANKKESSAYEKKPFIKENKILDINTADSTALIKLPGIGAGFARRIINFRNKLGGFVSVEQIGETYGLPDSTFQKIKPQLSISNSTIKQFNINTATVDELKTHPYIRFQLANAIVQFRSQHGNYQSINDIKKIMLVTDEIFNRVSAYLKIAD